MITKIRCKICRKKFEPLSNWMVKNSVCSAECASTLALKKIKDTQKEEYRQMKIICYESDNKRTLQNEINKLARNIDKRYGYTTCIDCGKPFVGQVDAAHYHSIGKNNTLRYNLHNIHSARGHCNQYSETHLVGYKEGLIKRYGEAYYTFIQDLKLTYKYIKVTAEELPSIIKIVRSLNRHIDTYPFNDAVTCREKMNKEIGIY